MGTLHLQSSNCQAVDTLFSLSPAAAAAAAAPAVELIGAEAGEGPDTEPVVCRGRFCDIFMVLVVRVR